MFEDGFMSDGSPEGLSPDSAGPLSEPHKIDYRLTKGRQVLVGNPTNTGPITTTSTGPSYGIDSNGKKWGVWPRKKRKEASNE
jgi:hypothetical protein